MGHRVIIRMAVLAAFTVALATAAPTVTTEPDAQLPTTGERKEGKATNAEIRPK